MAISPEAQTAASQPYEWRQVGTHEYRRPLFANEIFLAVKSLFDGTCTMITSLTVKGSSLTDAQDAWTLFPLLMPLVRMQLHRDRSQSKQQFEFSYSAPQQPADALTAWSKRTFRVFDGLDRRQLQERAIEHRNELHPTEERDASDVAHLYLSEDRNGLHMVFSFQHAVTDARGQWMMIDLFLKLCSGETAVDTTTYKWGLHDVALLPRPFHYAAGLRQDGDVPPFDALEMIHQHMAEDTHLVPFAGFPSILSSTPSAAVKKASPIQSLSIPAAEYKLLHSAAKVNDCTASAWVGAVLTLLMFGLNDIEEFKTFRFPLQPVDARRHMTKGSPNYYGVAIGGGNVDMKDLKTIKAALSDLEEEGPIPASFWAVSKEYKAGLEKLAVSLCSPLPMLKSISAEGFSAKHDKAGVLAAKEILEIIYPYVLADPKIGDMPSVFYTSLGRAQTYFKASYGDCKSHSVELEDLETFPLFHNTLLTMCSLMEFKGDLNITYQVPNNTYDQTFADNFANGLKSIFRRLVDGAARVDSGERNQ